MAVQISYIVTGRKVTFCHEIYESTVNLTNQRNQPLFLVTFAQQRTDQAVYQTHVMITQIQV